MFATQIVALSISFQEVASGDTIDEGAHIVEGVAPVNLPGDGDLGVSALIVPDYLNARLYYVYQSKCQSDVPVDVAIMLVVLNGVRINTYFPFFGFVDLSAS